MLLGAVVAVGVLSSPAAFATDSSSGAVAADAGSTDGGRPAAALKPLSGDREVPFVRGDLAVLTVGSALLTSIAAGLARALRPLPIVEPWPSAPPSAAPVPRSVEPLPVRPAHATGVTGAVS